MGCHCLLQGTFPTQGSHLHFLRVLHWQMDSSPLTHLGSLFRAQTYVMSVWEAVQGQCSGWNAWCSIVCGQSVHVAMHAAVCVHWATWSAVHVGGLCPVCAWAESVGSQGVAPNASVIPVCASSVHPAGVRGRCACILCVTPVCISNVRAPVGE